ncbi:MAG: hypothetical protein COA58_10700 [Bacteroidetes bacterium]|nr:MAG: hypothetical protein COA58_10700 [Bacteroidota bacterium]
MSETLLYIEDDEIDILTLKRLLGKSSDITLVICKSFSEAKSLDLHNYDAILSDSNLPDANYEKLEAYLPKDKTQFISGSEIEYAKVWIKPITEDQLNSLFQKNPILNMQYIKDLADGEIEYEQEMIDTALKVLPERWEELKTASTDLAALKKAAHKTKSSYRVCGIDNSLIYKLESLNDSEFSNTQKTQNLLLQIEQQISSAIKELKNLKN